MSLVERRAQTGYQQLEEIGAGEGCNSRVYRVFDARLNGEFVAKEIEKATFPKPIDEFYSEAQLMFSAEHPNVVTIRSVCETADHICLIMPFYPNGSLAKRIADGPLPPMLVKRIGRQVLTGLAKIHLAGILHLDIKPTNIFFASSGEAMIADFGQSKIVDPSGVTSPPDMYTESIPPEYFNHNSVLVESDIYHVGLTLYRACNGNPFYSSQIPASYDLPRQVVAGRFPDRSQFLPHVPKKLRTIIRRALEVEPADRFKTATDFSNELGKVHINHDWNVTFLPTGEVEWKANRPKKADLVVRLAPATSGWSTEIYGDRSGVRRKCSGVFWKSGLARKDADKHLKSIFEALG